MLTLPTQFLLTALLTELRNTLLVDPVLHVEVLRSVRLGVADRVGGPVVPDVLQAEARRPHRLHLQPVSPRVQP